MKRINDTVTKNEFVRKVSDNFMKQEFQRYCDLSIIEQANGMCITTLTVSSRTSNASNRLHAGILYSALDITAFLAALSVVDINEYPVTHNMSTSILSSVQEGEKVIFEASINRKGKKIIFIHSQALYYGLDGRRKIIAEALITKSIITSTDHHVSI